MWSCRKQYQVFIFNEAIHVSTKILQDVKISEDNILSDIMSDLDGNAPTSSSMKPKSLVSTKTSFVESSKKEAQNYFKTLSSIVKKSNTDIFSNERAVTPNQDAVSIEYILFS